MTKKPIPPKQLNAAAFKAKNKMIAQRIEPYWCAIDGGKFLIRPLTGRYGLYAETDVMHGMKSLIADVKDVVDDDDNPIDVTFEEVEVIGKPITVLSDETLERIPMSSWEKLMAAASDITTLSKEELLKQDFILPLQSDTSNA